VPIDELTTSTEESGSEPNPNRTARKRRHAIEWALIIVVAVLVSVLVRTFVFQTFFIPSSSMNPTLWKGDRIVVNKLSVEFGTINIGDIVVFKAPPDVAMDCGDPVTDLVKRVIGLPGDHLYSKGNTIFVNGTPLDQKWSVWPTLGTPIRPTTVAAGHYFMMGDWHSESCDSRTWGTVPRSDLIGKVFVRIWPLKSIEWF
jgi:signal peptidase I